MIGETFVEFPVPTELFLFTTLQTARDLPFNTTITAVIALKHKERCIVHYVRRVGGIDGTLAEREVIDSIEQVCLAHSITADKTIYLGRECNFHLLQVSIVE